LKQQQCNEYNYHLKIGGDKNLKGDEKKLIAVAAAAELNSFSLPI